MVRPAAAVLIGSVLLAGCSAGPAGQGGLSGTVRVDGSSTVAPLTTAAAEGFAERQPSVRVTVGTSGTGGGFEKFCNKETDLSDASRPISAEETAACTKNGVGFQPLHIADDALTVVVNKNAYWVDCLTTRQLHSIWQPDSRVADWSQVDPAFPDVPLQLFGPGTDSGTFDYFTEAVNGTAGASRTDYSPSEDDNVIVRGIAGSEGGLGYLGYSYFEENTGKLKALKIDSGRGCVAPGPRTAQDGSYRPLSRPLLVYASAAAVRRREVLAFLDYYVADNAALARDARFIPLSAAQEREVRSALDRLKEAAR